ncbi:hypothetical protein [Streptomyces sp. NBC_01180]|nr:hypothetical protein OG708_08930 [Streptomyces sp. NBC_01180]
MSTADLDRLRQQYAEIVQAMTDDSERAAYHFGRLEIVTRQLFRLIDRSV